MKESRKITVLSTRGFCGQGDRVNEFCTITAEITPFNTINFQWMRFEDYKVEFSELFSKLPVVRRFTNLTFFQQQYDYALEQIRTSDEVDVWSYRSTIAMLNNDFRRRHKKSKLARRAILPADNANIVELVAELPRKLQGPNVNLKDFCRYYGMNEKKLIDITKQLLDNEEYIEAKCPVVLVRGVMQMFIRLMDLGYAFDEIENAMREASWRFYENQEDLDEIYVSFVKEREATV